MFCLLYQVFLFVVGFGLVSSQGRQLGQRAKKERTLKSGSLL